MALQAPEGSRNDAIIKPLLGAQGDVNAPASKVGGRMKLQAAAENGHEEVARSLPTGSQGRFQFAPI